MELDGCHALITGASAGIGANLRASSAGRAASLVLVARRIDRLEELRDELTRTNPNLNIHLPRGRSLEAKQVGMHLCEWLDREKIAIDFLINNAGSAIAAHSRPANRARERDARR